MKVNAFAVCLPRSRLYALAVAVMAAALGLLALADDGPPNPAGVLFMETPERPARVSLAFLPEDAPPPENPGDGVNRLIITGAYSSGDRFAPEGFVLRRGDASHPWPQGWDGLLLVRATGEASIHYVRAVDLGGETFNLRDKESRALFLELAAAYGWSAIQSHLLISNGELDLRPVEDAPRFRRRMLFQMADGRIGVYDTSPRAVTLYEAAGELLDAIGPKMALNLDMGAYDFCEQARNNEITRCGRLGRNQMTKLTNLIVLERR